MISEVLCSAMLFKNFWKVLRSNDKEVQCHTPPDTPLKEKHYEALIQVQDSNMTMIMGTKISQSGKKKERRSNTACI